jgi:hypothetical protein
MTFFIWKRAGFIGLYTVILPILGAPWVVENYLADRYPNYPESTEGKLIAYGTAFVLTGLLTLVASSLFKKQDTRPFKEKLMDDHLYYVPLASWPLIILVLGFLSISNHWKY